MDVRRWVAGLLLVPLLAGCSDYAKSDGKEPPTSVSPTATESKAPEGPVEPELPERASKPTKAGAIAFVKYYWAVVDYAQVAGEFQALSRLASEDCKACEGGLKVLTRIHARGGKIVGPPARVTSAQASIARHGPKGQKFVTAQVRHEVVVPRTTEFYVKDDPRNKVWPAGANSNLFLMVWQEDSATWLVTDWEIE